MASSTFRAAKTLCNLTDWNLSNLPLQKLLYLAHMRHLGTNHARLIDGHFEAWDLGPVEPELYHKVKAYGSDPVVDIFAVEKFHVGQPEYNSIYAVFKEYGALSPGKLVALTHRDRGAWANYYIPDVRGVRIPDGAIEREYREFFGRNMSRYAESRSR